MSKECIYKSCHSPVVEGRSRCDYHLEQARVNARKARERHIEQGICGTCNSRKVTPGYKTCKQCRDYLKNYYKTVTKKKKQEARDNGVCYQCGEQVIGDKLLCDRCQGFGWSHQSDNRGIVLERDGYQCVVCGNKNTIVVHHIDGNGVDGDNGVDNLATMCSRCHKYTHTLANRLLKIPNWQKILSYSLRLV